ncbi:unnamed protein product [Bursaphelenchus xylophilus]|uniref:(pine wood nematode) hypothetical protein n=1 Tax=Bursaphelenchus xylophilus TaxID=6326 RepID=A0A1I7S578_BURXY|nr:unnamed protein product [Bursaphelenchus xylophilus]CAG9117789.1 unnamed protein product [Bursaphelenchus xylophilus]
MQPRISFSSKCVVCDDPSASKHYGKPCCSGCKGFFRRSVRFRRQYVCAFENECNIKGEARNSCRACRYRICLEQGLQPILVHSDRACDVDAPKRKICKALTVKLEKSESMEEKTDEVDLPSVSTSPVNDEKDLIQEAFKNCDTLLTARKTVIKNSFLPLGAMNLVPFSRNNTPASLLKYYFTVDRLVDNYFETKNVLFTDPIACDLEMSFDAAFLYEPGKMCDRTVMLWEPKMFITLESFKAMWCRVMLNFIDWVTHVPEIKALQPDDRIKMIVGRSVPIIWHIIAARSYDYVDKRLLLLGGGTYFTPNGDDMIDEVEDIIRNFCVDVGNWMYDAFFDPAVEIGVTKSELIFLRLISLFTMVPGLTPEGKKAVRSAQAFYRNTLHQHLNEVNPSMSEADIAKRMAELMTLLPPFERTNQIEDNHFTQLVVFNLANLQSSLMYDFYVRRKMRL